MPDALPWVAGAGAQACCAAKGRKHEAGCFDLYRHAALTNRRTTVLWHDLFKVLLFLPSCLNKCGGLVFTANNFFSQVVTKTSELFEVAGSNLSLLVIS